MLGGKKKKAKPGQWRYAAGWVKIRVCFWCWNWGLKTLWLVRFGE